jgi:sigma-B regulation protein RsbU (phosphoserine phosphatase)
MPTRPRLYLVLTLLLAATATVQVRRSLDVIELLVGGGRPRSPVALRPLSDVIARVAPEAADAGIKPGDRLLAVNGRAYSGEGVLGRAVATSEASDPLSLKVLALPENTERTVLVRLVEERVSGATLLLVAEFSLLTPVLCILLGFWVAFLRPREMAAWILLGLMVAFANMSPTSAAGWEDGLRAFGGMFQALTTSLWAIWMMLFGIYFPERLALDRRLPWLKWMLIGPLLAGALANTVEAYGRLENLELALLVARTMRPFSTVLGFLGFAAIGCFFAFLGIKGGKAKNPDSRRRLRLLVKGAQLSLGPCGALWLLNLLRGRATLEGYPDGIIIPALGLLALFPVTMAYVIVVHRAMEVRVAIRQGLQYALARGGVRVIQVIFSAVVIWVALNLLNQPYNMRRVDRVFLLGSSVTLILLAGRLAERLRSWLDRRFFREAVNAEQVLSELGETVRGIVETPKLLETVARRVSESLHVERVALLLGEGGGYCPAFVLGTGPSLDGCFPSDGAVARQLRPGAPAYVYLEDRESWVQRIPGEERGRLERLGAQLLVPLGSQDKMMGFLSLGPKQAEAPYTRSDVRLLASVAAQTGLALENSRLTAAIAQEVAQRERLNREIEIAREVQDRLFPQELPPIQGLDYYGACRPALGVGGDYYDFLAISGGSLGIAIGDVSGKGIAAALLMATLQAAVRGCAMTGEQDLGATMRHVNRLVYGSSASNRYATFFYARYDPASRRLAYVNAGHNPPLVLRGDQALRLEASGTVVGLLPDYPYQQAAVTLEPGDLLIAFTDGISEAMNSAREEWSEEAVIAAARACDGLSARETLERLVAAADAFAAGAPQHDDMTLVVGRVL